MFSCWCNKQLYNKLNLIEEENKLLYNKLKLIEEENKEQQTKLNLINNKIIIFDNFINEQEKINNIKINNILNRCEILLNLFDYFCQYIPLNLINYNNLHIRYLYTLQISNINSKLNNYKLFQNLQRFYQNTSGNYDIPKNEYLTNSLNIKINITEKYIYFYLILYNLTLMILLEIINIPALYNSTAYINFKNNFDNFDWILKIQINDLNYFNINEHSINEFYYKIYYNYILEYNNYRNENEVFKKIQNIIKSNEYIKLN
jgi:hypothetical protein